MSLLTMCRRVMEETGWPVPSSIVSSSDLTAKQIFAIANTELQSISEQFPWPALEDQYIFSTVPGQYIYTWPDQFRAIIPDALYNRDQYYALKGSYGPQEWLRVRDGALGRLDRTSFRVIYPFGLPFLELTPVPDTAHELIALYMSKEYAIDNVDGISVPLFAKDTDTSKVPERLVELGVKWRFRRVKGLDFSAELAEYLSTVRHQYATYLAPPDIPVGGPRSDMYNDIAPGYIPESGFGV